MTSKKVYLLRVIEYDQERTATRLATLSLQSMWQKIPKSSKS